ncbi:MAG TPA: hypothetical protein VGK77_13145 [Candidatus Binatia bacterium]
MKTLRWIAVLPAAMVCGYLAYFVGGFINNLSITLYLGAPPEGWLKVTADVMAHMYLGAAFTYSAVRVAPSAPRYVALAALVLLLVFAGLSLWSSFAIEKFYALPAIGGVLFGGTAALLATFAGEIVPYDASRLGRRGHA